MICKRCGTQIQEGWKVCPSCGSEILLETEATGVERKEYIGNCETSSKS